jgi:DMSO/TMAO reductase YedYZ molybdopterin-dependent catalytic subunit
MKATPPVDRRRFLRNGLGLAVASALAGCDYLSEDPRSRSVLDAEEWLNLKVQRLLLPRNRLAREYTEADISPYFKPNGTYAPEDPPYRALAARNFADWRLVVDGLVARPARLSLAELRALPERTQITRHDCVEGWSCIGKWSGVRLAALLSHVGLSPRARYIVFYCADTLDGAQYYESVDLIDAFHPQTLLAYDMNDRPLTIAHGAPLRLRVERQLGYKMAKYVMRVEAVDSYATLAGGKGGYWEDRGYAWYAGI